jgi:DNA polymerase-1
MIAANQLALAKLAQFREIIPLDFEFKALPGERAEPVCLVAKELRSGRVHRIFRGSFGSKPPYPIGSDALFVAYYSSAELGCYRALGWPMPERVLDLFCEFRNRTNGLPTPAGAGLLGALAYFHLDGINATEKHDLQQALGTGTWAGRYSEKEILDYCASDVAALERLLEVMLPEIDLPRALLRGRYMVAVSAMEFAGTPIDMSMLVRLREGWDGIQDRLIAGIDAEYGVYDGRSFRADRFAEWLIRRGIPWPCLESGHLDLSDDTFRQMAKSYPAVSPLRELRSALSELRLNDLAVGRDGRNRCLLSPFRSRTARNQPSNSRFIFGPSVWLRSLIKPPPGYGVAYVDWSQQEFAIAAALSGDIAMQAAYRSGDPYLAFGKQAGLIPEDGNKTSHGAVRELCKQCILAIQYGMMAESLAARIDQPVIVARDLLRRHHETYATFWRWSDNAVDSAMLDSVIQTRYGWTLHIGDHVNPRSLRNHPVQANGAEMMRIAACLATERGIEVCAPVHDAFLICAPLERLDADIAAMRAAMAEASRAVLNGFEIRTDCPDELDEAGERNGFPHVIRYPHRFMDKRGAVMWQRVQELLRHAMVPA